MLVSVAKFERFGPPRAAAHLGEYATVEGVVAKVFTSKSGNTFLNVGAAYPKQTFTGWIPPGIAGEQVAPALHH